VQERVDSAPILHPTFSAEGAVDFFGEEAMMRVDGAGGGIFTTRAILRHLEFCIPLAA